MTPLVPLSDVENGTLVKPRRRRNRSWLPFLGEEDRDRALDDLSQRAFPRLDFYLYIILAAALLSLSALLRAPALLVLAAVVAPLFGPLAGLALGIVTLSPRFALRNLAALVVAGVWVFLVALFVAWVGSVFAVPIAATRMPDLAGLVLAPLAAAWLTVQFIRSSTSVWIPNAVAAYLFLAPISAAAWNFLGGKNDGVLAGLLALTLYLVLALAASGIMFCILGLRPSEPGWRTYAGTAAAVLTAVVLLGVWIGFGANGALSTALATPTVQPTATEAFTPTIADAAPSTATPTRAPSGTPTGTQAQTDTPAFLPVEAVVHGTDALGANLRDKPDGKLIGSAMDGEKLLVIGTPTLIGTQSWIHVRNEHGLEAWMAVEFCATVTPARTSPPT